ncbi:MAG: MutS family DNA mismatch repair protein [Clostridiales bacterium]|nr:MutS family DNA mismatch repair protein [Clostridiales bacterium]
MSERTEKRDSDLENRSSELDRELKEISEKAGHLANIRGVCFLGVLAFVILYFSQDRNLPYLIGSLACLLIFIGLIIRHGKIKAKAKRIAVLSEINEQYIARTLHDFSKLEDDGSDLKVEKHPFAGDLDLFGPKSLFALINVAHTAYGRRQLRKWLLTADSEEMDLQQIKDRQAAVEELASQIVLVQELEAETKMNVKKKGSPQALLAFIASEVKRSKTINLIRIVNTCLMWASLIVAIIFGGYVFFAPLAFFVIQQFLMAVTYKNNAITFTLVEKFYPELRAYSNIFSAIENVEVKADYLVSLKKRLFGEDEAEGKGQSASNQLSSLYKICLLIQARMQPLLYFVLNTVLPFDELCLHLLENWRKESGSKIPEKLDAIGEWEALMSLSTVRMIYPEAGVPEIVDGEEPFFRGEGIGHPLISEKTLVRNDFVLEKGCAMITGSNMSGKTTLLRTVGINSVLAFAGAVCPCTSLKLSLMNIGASMRIEDNLGEGVSTFYAELVKIERIVKMAESGRPLLFLIDEIFRGTNSKDRTDGAWTVLNKLHKPTIIGLMSTHDCELCKMNTNNEVDLVYYHFSEFYDDDGLHFDYKLKNGMSTETNAKYLMKLVGITD